MARTRHPILEAIANPAKYPLLYFLILTPILGIAINGLSTLIFEGLCNFLEQKFGLSKLLGQFFLTGIFIALTLFLISNLYSLVANWREQILKDRRIETNMVALTDTFPGLIAIASFKSGSKKTPLEEAILHHWEQGKLRYCWVICSEDAKESTEKSVEFFKQKNISLQVWFRDGQESQYKLAPGSVTSPDSLKLFILIVKSPSDKSQEPASDKSQEPANDPNYIRQLVDWIYQEDAPEMGLDESQIIADYTGGTKSMTAGVVLACTNPSRRLEYIWSEYDKNGQILRSEVREVIISYKLKPVKRLFRS